MEATANREPAHLPRAAWLLVLAFAVVVALAWVGTVQTSADLSTLLALQLTGAAPAELLAYVALVAVMMGAMMLPSALPMLEVYRSLAIAEAGPGDAGIRVGLFASAYLFIWVGFTAVALVVLQGLGVLGPLTGPWAYLPGGLLVAAGAYQFSSWKQFCLTSCRTPFGFALTHWRKGRLGALRMGLTHSKYCLGCCWLLMLVVFVTGTMSLLWMGVFTGLILAEKVWSRGPQLARGIGISALALGGAAIAFTALGGL